MNPSVLFVLGLVGALPLVLAGLWMLRGGRVFDPERAGTNRDPGRQDPGMNPRPRISQASKTVVGLCLLIVGYHLAAYTAPAAWNLLRVPLDRAWILALGLAAAVGVSLGTDKLEGGK